MTRFGPYVAAPHKQSGIAHIGQIQRLKGVYELAEVGRRLNLVVDFFGTGEDLGDLSATYPEHTCPLPERHASSTGLPTVTTSASTSPPADRTRPFDEWSRSKTTSSTLGTDASVEATVGCVGDGAVGTGTVDAAGRVDVGDVPPEQAETANRSVKAREALMVTARFMVPAPVTDSPVGPGGPTLQIGQSEQPEPTTNPTVRAA